MSHKEKQVSEKVADVWIVLLSGLPGSGKSTLRGQLVKNGWQYVSQDELGSMDECGKKLVKAIKAGQSCVVDRCNVTSSERRLCMQFANRAVEKGEVKGVKLHFEAVWMATSPDVCKARAVAREKHETLSAEHAADVIDQFCKGLKVPQRTGQEPYDAVLSVACEEDAAIVLRRYASPGSVDTSEKTAPPSAISMDIGVPQPVCELDASLPAELFVVRHGERADRAKHRDEGWPDDAVLTKEGQDTAKRAGIALRQLAGSACAAVYSSPFCRCLQTADQIAAELGLLVRVEPGLCELLSVFERAPVLRSPSESLSRALQRSEVDCSVAPVVPALPKWPEEVRDSNKRVVSVARALASRHAGEAIVLVCHSHSVVEITRHLPSQGGGAASSHAGYCAMSNISQAGVLQRCLDLNYLKLSNGQSCASCEGAAVSPTAGSWSAEWQWLDPDQLLEMSLEQVLEMYPRFHEAFMRGTEEQRRRWLEGWARPDENLRRKLRLACEKAIFGCRA